MYNKESQQLLLRQGCGALSHPSLAKSVYDWRLDNTITFLESTVQAHLSLRMEAWISMTSGGLQVQVQVPNHFSVSALHSCITARPRRSLFLTTEACMQACYLPQRAQIIKQTVGSPEFFCSVCGVFGYAGVCVKRAHVWFLQTYMN